ncbi:hypothetical protein B0H15DRAFT_901270 [Mycena belliarum]|uniref:Uncharacterized protein n=1 Tax=Mycena belliarum TaxID=1033014 RepID=A0AAD6UHD5_9AGAR|nr:hypothetical protein B0H15DRAFT_901270 [Mycena belliae]
MPSTKFRTAKKWRQIALSTPQLWASLDIDVVQLGKRMSHRRRPVQWFNQAASWLHRAGSHPLSVTLRHPPGEEETKTTFQSDLTFLRQISDRVERLEVHGLEQERRELSFYSNSLDFTPGSFPLLRTLVFGPGNIGEFDNGLSDCWLGFFSDAPRLCELALLGEVVIASTPLPWHQLTKFIGYDLSIDDCLELLRLAPDLEECTFRIQSPITLTPPPVIHTNMKSLILLPDSEGECWFDSLMAALTLPALETLTLTISDMCASSVFEAFLSRSSAPLRHVLITPNHGPEFADWSGCFHLMPDLEHLDIAYEESQFQADFITAFGTSEELLLPQLRHLNFYRPTARLTEVSSAVAQRKILDPEGKLQAANVLWEPEDMVFCNSFQSSKNVSNKSYMIKLQD